MDTSEQYIKMCDCPEIQEQWKVEEGDWVAFCGDVKAIADYEIWALEKRELSDIECWNEVVVLMGGHFVDHFMEARECFVFLPRQDQIQEMMGFHDFNFNQIEELRTFYEVTDIAWQTWEQLWFATYMHKCHKNNWDGKEWIKNKRREEGE